MNGEEPLTMVPEQSGRFPVAVMVIIGVVAFLAGIALMLLVTRIDRATPEATPSPTPSTSASPAARATAIPALPPGTDLATLNAREEQLAGRLDAIEARITSVDGESRLASRYATRAEGLLIAVSARRLLDRGQPLGGVESQLRLRFGEEHPAAVSVIVRAGAEPVTIEDLRLALDTIAPRLTASGADESIWKRIRRVFDDLIVVRRETSPSPRPSDRLRRARRMMEAGQVEAAVAEIAHMPGADNARSWMTAARRYIDARQALAEIELAAMTPPRESPAPAPSPSPTPRQ